MPLIPIEEPKELVTFSNVSVVRDADGKHHLYIGSEKALGQFNLQMQPLNDGSSVWSVAFPSNRVRIVERVPPAPVYEYKDNVVPFTKVVHNTYGTTGPESA